MKSRDLLLLSKKASPDPKEVEQEVEQLHEMLHHAEAFSNFCISNEIMDLNSYKIIQKANYSFIQKFSSCWVPDADGGVNLAGLLSHTNHLPAIPVKYLGVLSRFQSNATTVYKYKCLIVLSGPEPQRTSLENKMLSELRNLEGTAMLVRGMPGNMGNLPSSKNVVIYNHLSSSEMEAAFNESEFVISRSGYTTVMDICQLRKKSILIPTPGQTEQEYLAKHLGRQGFCLTAEQHDFNLKLLLDKASKFEFKFPQVPLDTYKKVIEDFVGELV